MKPAPVDLHSIEEVLRAAVREDLGSGDITSSATVPESARALGRYTAKQPLVVSGVAVVERLISLVHSDLRYQPLCEDGDVVAQGTPIAEVRGPARYVLAAERVTLNMLQRMCGIATFTAQYVERVKGTNARVADTRKTVPGLRVLDKYAVACGGGVNHRMGLFDAVLIKNNHLEFHPSIGAAIQAARARVGAQIEIEVEVPRPEDVVEAIEAGADMILLDNFTPEQTRQAVVLCAGRVPLESSGGITLDTIRAFAEAGVDRISVGALTHSPPAADIHLRVTPWTANSTNSSLH
jgi:nicotinate-nucleotide pyrophosphorylase (carboxylating)